MIRLRKVKLCGTNLSVELCGLVSQHDINFVVAFRMLKFKYNNYFKVGVPYKELIRY